MMDDAKHRGLLRALPFVPPVWAGWKSTDVRSTINHGSGLVVLCVVLAMLFFASLESWPWVTFWTQPEEVTMSSYGILLLGNYYWICVSTLLALYGLGFCVRRFADDTASVTTIRKYAFLAGLIWLLPVWVLNQSLADLHAHASMGEASLRYHQSITESVRALAPEGTVPQDVISFANWKAFYDAIDPSGETATGRTTDEAFEAWKARRSETSIISDGER